MFDFHSFFFLFSKIAATLRTNKKPRLYSLSEPTKNHLAIIVLKIFCAGLGISCFEINFNLEIPINPETNKITEAMTDSKWRLLRCSPSNERDQNLMTLQRSRSYLDFPVVSALDSKSR